MNRKRFALFIGLTLPLAALAILLSWMPKGPTASWQPVAQAQGTVITVTTGADNTANDDVNINDCTGNFSGCTLREAIERSNTLAGDIRITFDQPYTITITYREPPGDGPVLSFDSLIRDNVHIDGDLDDDCVPDVVLNGENITDTNESGRGFRFFYTDGGMVEGLVIQNFKDYGINLSGANYVTVTCNYIGTDLTGRQAAPNRLGIYILREAHDNLVTENVIAGNSQNGVHISARPGHETTYIPYENTISDNWIGTNPWGDDLGNQSKGVLIQHNAYDNLVLNNIIRYNGCYGVHLRGRDDNGTGFDYSDDNFYPPQGNQILDNFIADNNREACPGAGTNTARAGLVSEDTHTAANNIIPSLASADYDNIIASNVISSNGGYVGVEPIGFGIYNLGASPLVSDNLVQGNTQYGIYNLVDFNGTFSPKEADDDILSIPIIQANTVQYNGEDGVRSFDTAPVAPYQVHLSNTVQYNDQGAGGEQIDVSQVWYSLVEVLRGDGTLTNTVAISQNAAPVVTNLDHPDYRYEFYNAITVGLPFAGSLQFPTTLWARDNDTDYFDVTSWGLLPQFVVTGTTNLRAFNFEDYSPQSVIVDLAQASVFFTATHSYDGLASTDPVTKDMFVPAHVTTGPYDRYQVAQVYILDSDNDTIPDDVECEGDECQDTDDDGVPDYLDDDSDDDGIPDSDECPGGPPCQDTDGDGIPDYIDEDDDGDGIDTIDEDIDGDGDPTNDDTDGDGIPDYLDDDDDGDGVLTEDECPGGPPCQDTDGDGTPDYLDEDDDGDGVDTIDEDIDGDGDPTNDDTDGDGTPDYLDEDDDGDGVDTIDEDIDGDGDPTNDDTDGDGTPDYLDTDDDGDGVDTIDEDVDGDGDPTNDDTDGDGTPDYLDTDDDGDGVDTIDEDVDGDGDPTNDDTDGDGTPDYLDEDDDGDGIDTIDEDVDGDGDPTNDDSDGDGTPDYLDDDDDDDGIPTDVEHDWCLPDGPIPCDADGDGTPDYLDTDSDDDGLPDSEESDTCTAGDEHCICDFGDPPGCYTDSDDDGTPDWLDPDRESRIYLPIVLNGW